MNVSSAFVSYNANPNNTHTGDCVKRAISIALGMDYNEVGKKLNAINRQIKGPGYNYFVVFSKFLRDNYNINFKTCDDKKTVKEFAEEHPQGIYLLLTGRGREVSQGHDSHLLAVVNGDIYDSWNSQKDTVMRVAEVQGVSDDRYEINIVTVSEQVGEAVDAYIQTLKSKNRFHTISDVRTIIRDFNKYDATIFLYAEISKDIPRDVYRWDIGDIYCHKFVLKVNPRMSLEENVASLIKKTKQKVYDYLYNLDTKVTALEKASNKAQFNDSLTAREREYVATLPEWTWPLIREIEYWPGYYTGGSYNDFPYRVFMKPLPGDPRPETVMVEGTTLREFKNCLEEYKNSFRRVNYDY